jgi:hypothetical protein
MEARDYRVLKEMILEWQGLYAEVLTDLVEDVFEESVDSAGDNTSPTRIQDLYSTSRPF